MPRTSLSALEILLRQTREDVELEAFPLVRANLMSMIRAYQRMDLDQGEQDIACGRVLNRRYMLLLVPGGRLKGPDAMNLVVRIEEQNVKANSALRRASGGRRQVPTAPVRKQVPTSCSARSDEDEQEHEAGDVPAEIGGGDA